MTSTPAIQSTEATTDEPVTQCGMTPQEEAKWADTVSMMAWTAPGFRHLWYKMLSQTHNSGGSPYVAVCTKDCGIAATDGQNLLINPERFFKMGLPERVYVAAHEIVHNVYGDVELLHRCMSTGKVPMHDGTSVPFDNDTMQKAMDARINALLDESKIGKKPLKIDGQPVGHYDKEVKGDASVLDVYRRYYEDKFPDGEGGLPGGNNPGGFDSLMKPGQSTGQNPQVAQQQRNPSQWAVEIAAAQTIEQMKSQGKMAGALKRMFESILEPEVNWLDHIATLINRTCGDGSYDWSHPDEWFSVLDVYSPKPTGQGAGWIVLWGDTSGSRNDKEIASNVAELAGMLADVNPERLTVIWCDAEIDYIDEIEDPMDLEKIVARGTAGGGGTSQAPVFDWIAKQMDVPDLYIGFTDGFVDFPEREPRYPVIWASSTDQSYPWGQVVRVNKRK
jgi:predicted metal-dependent peptidase